MLIASLHTGMSTAVDAAQAMENRTVLSTESATPVTLPQLVPARNSPNRRHRAGHSDFSSIPKSRRLAEWVWGGQVICTKTDASGHAD
jgi:hypothetical protein